MLRIVNLEEIEGILLRVPDLVDHLDRRDPAIVSEVKQWMQALEAVLEYNRMAVVGSVSALRGMLTAAERGFVPAGVDFRGRPSPRKIREAIAADLIHRVDALVAEAIRADATRIEEARGVMRQLVALAHYKGLIPQQPADGDHVGYLNAVWRAMTSDSDVGPGTAHLTGLVGPHDAHILLDRTLTSDVFSIAEG
jgi:hypothetical protein